MNGATGRLLSALGAALTLSLGAASAQENPESAFLTDATRGNIAEVKMGELAQQRGQSEGIRAFGEMLVEDHSKALKESAELAKDLDVVPPALPSAEQTQKHDSLARLQGAEFDQAFAGEMVKAHQETIAKYEKQAQRSDSKVAKLAKDALPMLQAHLAMAQQLERGEQASHDRAH